MENARTAADRVRGILQSMERSIDEARRERLHRDDPTPAPRVAPRPVPLDRTETDEPDGERPPQRLKARPKRATPMGGFDSGTLRSRAS